MRMTSARTGRGVSPTMIHVGLLSLGVAIVILAGLALQMAVGRDPALEQKGAGPEAGAPEDSPIEELLSSITGETESPAPLETTTS